MLRDILSGTKNEAFICLYLNWPWYGHTAPNSVLPTPSACFHLQESLTNFNSLINMSLELVQKDGVERGSSKSNLSFITKLISRSKSEKGQRAAITTAVHPPWHSHTTVVNLITTDLFLPVLFSLVFLCPLRIHCVPAAVRATKCCI